MSYLFIFVFDLVIFLFLLFGFYFLVVFFFFIYFFFFFFFFFSSRRRHTRCLSDWSSDVCSSDLCRRAPRPAAGRPCSGSPGPSSARWSRRCRTGPWRYPGRMPGLAPRPGGHRSGTAPCRYARRTGQPDRKSVV